MKSIVALFAIVALAAAAEDCKKVCTRIYMPVCSSDGKTLPNKCEFEVYQCLKREENVDVAIAHDGECQEVVSGCPIVCPAVWHPVCGSDGKTYDNDCYLEAASCRSFKDNGEEITLEHEGACLATYQECPVICTSDWRPVCASNGKTYSNPCRLEVADCRSKMQNGPSIVKVHMGVCEEQRSAPVQDCLRACPAIWAPVCSSDGKTFDNKCQFEAYQCEQLKENVEVSLVHAGPCREKRSSENECMRACPAIWAPVCSSDGKTFASKCNFEAYQCELRKENVEVSLAHVGPCREKRSEDECMKPCDKVLNPQCSSDGRTLDNRCLFEIYQCQQERQGNNVVLAHAGPCKEKRSEDPCMKPCNRMLKPVCSSDEKTFGNKCLFEIYQCQQASQGNEVVLAHDGPCRTKRSDDPCVKPCDRVLNPQCSSDGRTLGNRCLFDIYQCQQERQRNNVVLAHSGPCKEKRSEDPCIKPCNRMLKPVCSSDGKTFGNKCLFEIYQCQQTSQGNEVVLAHDGPCRSKRSDDPCVKPCDRMLNPQCSSDGRTLGNKCLFEMYQCQQERQGNNVVLAHAGPCKEKRTEDDCMKPCDRVLNPQCSSDGHTLNNRCLFEIYQCQKAREGNDLVIAHAGPCREKRNEHPCFKPCNKMYAPVCSSDGKTLSNKCSFEVYQCTQRMQNNDVSLVHNGPC